MNELKINNIYQGEALEVLKTFPDESIDCVITSPPYWALRDYGVEGQLGLESTFQEYIDKLCNVFDEIKRVLKKEGTCWVNIGDTYMGNSSYSEKGRQGFGNDKIGMINKKQWVDPKYASAGDSRLRAREHVESTNIKSKSLCMIPSRFAIEMINRGWILRNEIIWHKPNCMPSSVKDRFTVDFEKIFFFVKSKKYFFETQREPHNIESIKRDARGRYSDKLDKGEYSTSYKSEYVDYNNLQEKLENGELRGVHPVGRNKRTVWDITTKGFSGAHFAVFPEKLIETPIKAGCPSQICSKCGKARELIIEREGQSSAELAKNLDKTIFQSEQGQKQNLRAPQEAFNRNIINKGYSDCGCNEKFNRGITLDPFMGAGTTGLVALKLGRNYVGIELNSKYIEIAKKRISEIPTGNLLDY